MMDATTIETAVDDTPAARNTVAKDIRLVGAYYLL